MLQRLFYIWKGIELQKFIGFCEFGSPTVDVLLKGKDFFFGYGAFGFEGGVDIVDEKIDPEIEL